MSTLARPGTIRVRLRLNGELYGRLKVQAKEAGVGYTTLARAFVAQGVELQELKNSLTKTAGEG